jgi:capsular polysaccharide transport system permease protein
MTTGIADAASGEGLANMAGADAAAPATRLGFSPPRGEAGDAKRLAGVEASGAEAAAARKAAPVRNQRVATRGHSRAPFEPDQRTPAAFVGLNTSQSIPRADIGFPKAAPRWPRIHPSFFVCVILPTLLAAGYYLLIARDEYATEFRFSVTEQTPALPGSTTATSNTMSGQAPSTSSSSLSQLAPALFSGSTPTTGSLQNFVVIDFVESPGAVLKLQERLDLRSMFATTSMLDVLGLKPQASMDKLTSYWQRMTDANYDSVTSLAYVRIRAFSPQDALRIGETLLQLSEELVNDIANRASRDAVGFAENEVERSKNRLDGAARKMFQVRNTEKTVNPSVSYLQANISAYVSQKMSVIQLQSQMEALKSSLSPTSPLYQELNKEVAAGQKLLQTLENEHKDVGDSSMSIAEAVGQYEQADIERQYAAAAYQAALQALDQARANAAAKHIYLTPYSVPYLPDESNSPLRWTNTFVVFVGSFFLWLIGMLLFKTVLDHQR